jgi:pyrimidine-specific ribonucleoside hydrolase
MKKQMFSTHISKYKSELKSFASIILLLVLGGMVCSAHSGKARYHIIIDTDTAVDDLRAICLFLASPEFEVLAVTTSDGVIGPEQGWIKVQSLLRSFGHEGIPTGAGKANQEEIPPWRAFNRKVQWGEEVKIENKDVNSAVDAILSALELEEEPVLFVCLGGLTNLANALETKPEFHEKIERIIWYNDSIDPLSGTNYEFDKKAAHSVFSINVTLEAVSNNNADDRVINPEFIQSISDLNSPYAEMIASTHSDDGVIQRITTGHLELWDDLLPVYLLHPELFVSRTSKKSAPHKLFQAQDWEGVKAKYLEILSSRNQVMSKVFKGFPDLPELYADDVQPYMNGIIQKHGKEEWRIGVLTNEMHGHLGIYAVVGAKMGLRARQYFHIGVDDISILSHAGSTPPLSCMNDGLQVSTGGTIGHGLITVSPDPPFQPKANFTFKAKSVCLRLKEKYWNIIRSDIRTGIELYGLNTEDYWKHVRKLALNYWLEWDRMEIFDIAPQNCSPRPDSNRHVG